MLNKDNTTIGFIGTGVMGKSMASHLIKQGFKVIVYNRTKSKAEELIKQGAEWKGTVAEVASGTDVIITMVGYPSDVKEIYLGENGIIKNTKAGSYLIDMTTSSPALAKIVYKEAKLKKVFSLDAPVSGGDVGAKNAELTIMVGGDKNVFEAIEPIFEVFGSNITLQGGAGAGQHTKMCNQIAIASNMIGVCEAVAYAEKAGLDPFQVLKSIGSGAAGSWSLNNLAPRIIVKDFEPGFYVKHFIKDMNIALQSAEEMGLSVPGLKLSNNLYNKLMLQGEGDSGTQALYKLFT